MKLLSAAAALALALPPFASGSAATPDDVAGMLVAAGTKPTITVESLPGDFAQLAKLVAHEGNGQVLFSDVAPAEGHVRHAQAHYDILPPSRRVTDKIPLFSVAFELSDEPDFTFENVAAAMERRLGAPTTSSNRPGAMARIWLLKQPAGRTFMVARAQASDNGDPITIVELVQNR